MHELQGQVAIISGGLGDIGRACAIGVGPPGRRHCRRRLSSTRAGQTRCVAEIERLGRRFHFANVDVSDAAAVPMGLVRRNRTGLAHHRRAQRRDRRDGPIAATDAGCLAATSGRQSHRLLQPGPCGGPASRRTESPRPDRLHRQLGGPHRPRPHPRILRRQGRPAHALQVHGPGIRAASDPGQRGRSRCGQCRPVAQPFRQGPGPHPPHRREGAGPRTDGARRKSLCTSPTCAIRATATSPAASCSATAASLSSPPPPNNSRADVLAARLLVERLAAAISDKPPRFSEPGLAIVCRAYLATRRCRLPCPKLCAGIAPTDN